ncbi:MAG: hypothetical protein R6U29_12655 [Desulfosudaceae bacterium]
MKQKFSLTSKSKDELVLTEFSELEKNEYTMIYTTTYAWPEIRKAAKQGLEMLMPALRHQDFFPPAPILEKVAGAVLELSNSSDLDTVETTIDDNHVFEEEDPDIDIEEDIELDDLDEILETDDSLDDDDDLVDDDS